MTDAELLTAILNAYALTSKDITTITDAIIKARLTLMQEAYRRGQRIAGLAQNWTPSDKVQRQVARKAMQAAKGIAETFRAMLTTLIERTLHLSKSMRGLRTYGWRDVFGSVGDAIKGVLSAVGEWFGGLMGWKPTQIATTECGGGVSDGTALFIDDVMSAQEGDGVVEGDDGETLIDLSVMNVDEIGVMVTPAHSSSDRCADFAGNVYPIDEYLSLGVDFPLHTSCIHSTVIVSLAS